MVTRSILNSYGASMKGNIELDVNPQKRMQKVLSLLLLRLLQVKLLALG